LRPGRRDLLLALVVAAAAMTLYLRTMLPGVGGGGDTVKFQYIGGVLGTAHPPGYPLYIFVSYVFAHLPFGTPAFRINFMSGFFAAAASALVCLVLLTLGCRRIVAVTMALALAFDRVLWAKATGAEVYALAGFLVALIALCAIRWAATTRDRDLYLMVAAFALSLGNHLTVATMFPALALFVIIVSPRTVRPVTIGVSALICVIGLAQYGFIVLRTRQHAPYVEAHATNLKELYATVRAAPYADEIFTFTTRQLRQDRLPMLWQKLQTELNPGGLCLLAIGLAVTAIRRPSIAILFGLGATGVLFLTLNVDADVDGFLVPAVVLLWVLVALGLDAVLSWLARAGRPGVAVASAAAIALPLWQIDRNYKVSDHHQRTYEIHYLDALFPSLENRVAFVHEAYPVDQLILYKVAGERANGSRTVTIIRADQPTVQSYAKDGFTIYAFGDGRRALEGRGLGFEQVQLRTPPSAAGPGSDIDMAALPLFKLTRRTECLPMGNLGWREVSSLVADGRAMLRIDNYHPFDSTEVLYVAGEDMPSAPSLVISQGPVAPSLTVTTFRTSESREAGSLARILSADAVPAAEALRRQPVVHRMLLKVNDRGDFSQMAVALGGRPRVVWVRASVDLNNPQRATVCGWSARDFFSDERRIDERLPLASDGDAFFGQGWRPAEQSDGGADVRWTTAPTAEIALPLARDSALHLHFRAIPAEGNAPVRTIDVSINGHAARAQPIKPGWHTYDWDVPADQLIKGLNRLTIDVAPPAGTTLDLRTLTLEFSEIVLTRPVQVP
jgi:hypothetical protein